jgi:hypothetical protein
LRRATEHKGYFISNYLQRLGYLTHRGKRSYQGKQHQVERSELAKQKDIAKWLINGTKHKDLQNKESVVKLTTEDVYDYIKDVVGQEPNPRCVPQQIDGTVTDIPNLYHYELFPVDADGLS